MELNVEKSRTPLATAVWCLGSTGGCRTLCWPYPTLQNVSWRAATSTVQKCCENLSANSICEARISQVAPYNPICRLACWDLNCSLRPKPGHVIAAISCNHSMPNLNICSATCACLHAVCMVNVIPLDGPPSSTTVTEHSFLMQEYAHKQRIPRNTQQASLGMKQCNMHARHEFIAWNLESLLSRMLQCTKRRHAHHKCPRTSFSVISHDSLG
jgi:hypothetical protein